ncbi:MAG TPA: NADPH-dependent F420 reductase [Nodosilinea sp.]|nr:NADPH-dependent F420 reductase [Nodosilinea sp.]
MKIGILGSGNMGAGLGLLWAKAGHEVIFSYSRDGAKLKHLADLAGPRAQVGTPAAAVAQSEVVMLAVGLPLLEDAIAAGSPFDGKIIITCVSGLRPDFTGQTVGLATELTISVAEQVQQLAPQARVVEAFNLTFAEIIAAESRQLGGQRPSLFYCGDDGAAKATVAGLIEDCGYDALDAGGLRVARSLETLATAWVQFAVASGQFPAVGLKVLQG